MFSAAGSRQRGEEGKGSPRRLSAPIFDFAYSFRPYLHAAGGPRQSRKKKKKKKRGRKDCALPSILLRVAPRHVPDLGSKSPRRRRSALRSCLADRIKKRRGGKRREGKAAKGISPSRAARLIPILFTDAFFKNFLSHTPR